MQDFKNNTLAIFSYIFIGFFSSCSYNETSVDEKISSLQKNEFLTEKFGKEIFLQGDLYYDAYRDIAYYSGYLRLEEAEETGNYIFDFKNGNVLNNYIDANKSERSIQEGPTDKNHIIGVGREFGVRMYAEFDKERLNYNQLAMFQIDTTQASIKLHLQTNDTITSSLELKDNFIIVKKGIPNYSSIDEAANDVNLPSGAMFKVLLNEKVSSLYIKN